MRTTTNRPFRYFVSATAALRPNAFSTQFLVKPWLLLLCLLTGSSWWGSIGYALTTDGSDPIRFSVSLQKQQITMEDEVYLTITAELLNIPSSLMFFKEGTNAFKLKLLMPAGFHQTGGTYADYVGTTLSPTKPTVTYVVRGYFTHLDEAAEFRLLRGDSQADAQSIFVEKVALPVKRVSALSPIAQPLQSNELRILVADTGSPSTKRETASDQSDTQVNPRQLTEQGALVSTTFKPGNTLAIGTVRTAAAGSIAEATITGASQIQWLNLTIPRGPAGPANTLAIGTVKTGKPGSQAEASITGDAPNQKLNLILPQGAMNAVAATPTTDIVVSGYTNAAVQAAIDAAPATGARIILPAGDYTFTNNIVIQNKMNITLEGYGAANIKANAFIVWIWLFGTDKNIRIQGINFSQTYTASNVPVGLIGTNETSILDGFEVQDCQFTAPTWDGDIFLFTAWSETAHSGSSMVRKVDIHHNRFVSCGRMAIELINHGWSDNNNIYRFDNIQIANNYFEDLGRVNSNAYGMAVSLSGLGQNLTVTDNKVVDAKGIAYEIVGGRYVSVTGNVARYTNNQFVGISITDNNHNVTEQITVTGNTLNTKGRAIQVYGGKNCTITANTFFALQGVDFIINSSTISGNTINAQGSNVLTFQDGSSNNLVTGNSLSNVGYSDPNALISFRGGSTRGNLATANRLLQGGSANRAKIEQINGSSGNTVTGNMPDN